MAGGFSLLKGRQDRAEKDRDRHESRRVLHRSTRRDAYLEFLNAYGEIDHVLTELWMLQPPETRETQAPSEFRDMDRAYGVLRKAQAVVALEGPQAVAAVAHVVVLAVREEHKAITEVCFRHVGDSEVAITLATVAERGTEANRHRVHGELLGTARHALGGDAPDFG